MLKRQSDLLQIKAAARKWLVVFVISIKVNFMTEFILYQFSIELILYEYS